MSWRTISEAEFLLEGFNPSEKTSVTSTAGGDEGLTELLASGIAQWRGLIEAGGTTLASAGKVPDSIRPYLVAQLRWQLLIKFPALKSLQTEVREKAAERAEAVLDKLADGDWPIEPADGDTSLTGGAFGGATRIVMATDAAAQTAATPVISGTAASVTIACATSAAAIYYTTDGSTPVFIGEGHWRNVGTLYAAAFAVTAGATVKAIAGRTGFTTSTVASATISA